VRFYRGHALFNKVFLPEEGLGPAFNENQCSACHTSPASGGTGGETITKATSFSPATGCNLLVESGGENIRGRATPLLAAHGITGERVPENATGVGRFTATFLFGLGLIEAIPDDAIVAREDPDDRDGDGVSGRASRLEDGRIGRFGRKADVASIMEFVESALRLEMGLTTSANPLAETVNGGPVPAGTDPVPDPEIDREAVELLTDYVRLLAPPARAVLVSEDQRASVRRGEAVFNELRCSSCHVPSLQTGRSETSALDRKTVALYSDLLLHDMGPGLADICGVTATPSELRTEPLMGVRHRDMLLHTGGVFELREAILRHGGEAQGARDGFAALSWLSQEDLVNFLKSL